MHFSSARQFKLWDYSVSHRQLLIRSPTTPDVAGNVDIVFWEVEYIAIPTVFEGIRLDASTNSERMSVVREIGGELSSILYCIATAKQRHFIAAEGFKVLNNELDIFDSTLVYFGVRRPPEWYGKVVAHS